MRCRGRSRWFDVHERPARPAPDRVRLPPRDLGLPSARWHCPSAVRQLAVGRLVGPEGEEARSSGVFLGAFLGVAGGRCRPLAGERPWFGPRARRRGGIERVLRLLEPRGPVSKSGGRREPDDRRRPLNPPAPAASSTRGRAGRGSCARAWRGSSWRSRSPLARGSWAEPDAERRRPGWVSRAVQSFSIVSKEGAAAPRSIFETHVEGKSRCAPRERPASAPRALRRWRRFAPNRACSDTRPDPQMIRHRRLRDATGRTESGCRTAAMRIIILIYCHFAIWLRLMLIEIIFWSWRPRHPPRGDRVGDVGARHPRGRLVPRAEIEARRRAAPGRARRGAPLAAAEARGSRRPTPVATPPSRGGVWRRVAGRLRRR